MSTHTPGPWSVTEDVVGRMHVDSQYAGPGRDYTPVADVHQGKADASLIAAAPEMLAFVQNIAARDGQHVIYLSPGGPHALDCAPCAARALLAKITGKEG